MTSSSFGARGKRRTRRQIALFQRDRHDNGSLTPLRRYPVERRQFTGCELSTTFIAVSVFTPWATAAAIDGNPSWDSAIVSPAVFTIRQRQDMSGGVLKAVTRMGTASWFWS
jgi:hypothetical protein